MPNVRQVSHPGVYVQEVPSLERPIVPVETSIAAFVGRARRGPLNGPGHIEESLERGTGWAVFKPNAEPLWSQLRPVASTFLHGLLQQGAFQGASPDEGYLVRCDATTTPQADVDRGVVNLVVGFAPLKPAEFILLPLQLRTRDPEA